VAEVRVYVGGFPDSDPDERVELAWGLEDDLAAYEVGRVSRAPALAPAGAKGAALEWAQLVVALTGTVPGLVAAVRSWLERHPRASVTLEIEGDRVTLTGSGTPEGRELLEAWLDRHGDG
jgi:hypothetical protein